MQHTQHHRTAENPRTSPTRAFLLRLHLYISVLIAPFIFIAALTGLIFVLTPQIEKMLYADSLYTQRTGTPHSLATQAQAARDYINDSLDISMVRPAPSAHETTRIMFSDPTLDSSQNRTIFVDPYSLAITGDMATYGTSGSLPFRTTIDYFHRDMLLGNWGRYYSELAASWLWIIVITGTVLWATKSKTRIPVRKLPPLARKRWLHGTIGVTAAVFLIFLSVTGLTWSQEAGARIKSLRAVLDWSTPAVSITLPQAHSPEPHAAHTHDEHAEHSKSSHSLPNPDLSIREDRADQLDVIYAAALAAGIDSPHMEIRLPKPNTAWSVREYDRSWPTQVDAIALHPLTLEVTSRADFAEFGIVPKLIRWGIDAHMGILFGWLNQLLMAATALALIVVIIYGYAMWWKRSPRQIEPLSHSWKQLPVAARFLWLLLALALGWALPLVGASLVVFVMIDVLLTKRKPSR